jgi:hypothetical protein
MTPTVQRTLASTGTFTLISVIVWAHGCSAASPRWLSQWGTTKSDSDRHGSNFQDSAPPDPHYCDKALLVTALKIDTRDTSHISQASLLAETMCTGQRRDATATASATVPLEMLPIPVEGSGSASYNRWEELCKGYTNTSSSTAFSENVKAITDNTAALDVWSKCMSQAGPGKVVSALMLGRAARDPNAEFYVLVTDRRAGHPALVAGVTTSGDLECDETSLEEGTELLGDSLLRCRRAGERGGEVTIHLHPEGSNLIEVPPVIDECSENCSKCDPPCNQPRSCSHSWTDTWVANTSGQVQAFKCDSLATGRASVRLTARVSKAKQDGSDDKCTAVNADYGSTLNLIVNGSSHSLPKLKNREAQAGTPFCVETTVGTSGVSVSLGSQHYLTCPGTTDQRGLFFSGDLVISNESCPK